jgi:hypothetical protein
MEIVGKTANSAVKFHCTSSQSRELEQEGRISKESVWRTHKVVRVWRKLHDKELYNLHSLSYIEVNHLSDNEIGGRRIEYVRNASNI